MKVVQQLTCLTLGRPNSPAYLTGDGEPWNTPHVFLGCPLDLVLSTCPSIMLKTRMFHEGPTTAVLH